MVLVVLYIGPTRYILHSFLEGVGDYSSQVVGMSFWSDAQNDSGWQNWWTAYYWPWWMTWAPLWACLWRAFPRAVPFAS
ncbi:BCCT family transporter [Oceanimonas sp. NS1]|nr:BCCT family transporter [Oceanimonas sp. NS1]